MVNKRYLVVFGSLQIGFHDFEYQLTEEFFSSLEQDLIHEGDVHVLLKLEKSERRLLLDFTLTGWVKPLFPVTYIILTAIVFYMLKRKREKEEENRSE